MNNSEQNNRDEFLPALIIMLLIVLPGWAIMMMRLGRM
jgi:hypothetical protein